MKSRFALTALCLCISWARPSHADAEEPLPSSVAWPDVIQLMHTRSPRLAAFRSQVKVADSEVGVASLLPNPSFNYTGFGLVHGSNYGTQHQIGLEQPLLIGGQRGAHVRAAKRRAEATRAEIAVSESELERDALHAWVQLLAAQARLEELARASADVAAVFHTVHERVAAGAEAQYDQSRVELESAQLASKMAEAKAGVTEAAAELAAALGLPGWQPQARGELSPLGVSGDFDQLWHSAQHALPSLAAAERRAWAARSEIDVARSERWGIPSINGGTFLTTSQGSAALFLGVSAPLPLFNFGGAAVDRANAGVASADAERVAVETEAHAALKGALQVLAARKTALDSYDQGVSNRLPGLREMADAAYRSGTASLLELLDSVRSAIEVRLARIEIVGEVLQSEIDVLVAAGMLHQTAAAAVTASPAAKTP